MDRSKQTVAGLFCRAAAGYDQVGFFHQVAQRLLALAGVSQGMRVLDVACGSGAVLVPAAPWPARRGWPSGSTWPSPWRLWPPGSCGGWTRAAERWR